MRTIHATNLVIALLVAAALVVPRFMPRAEGFTSAAGAVLVFLIMLGAATLVGVWLAAWTWRHASLPRAGRWLGFAPGAFGVVTLAALLVWLRY